MIFKSEKEKLLKSLCKELAYIEKQEKRMQISACRERIRISEKISEKIPDKVESALKKAFSKAFELVFNNGGGILEKTFDKKELEDEHKLHNYAIEELSSRKNIRKIRRSSLGRDMLNSLCTTAEGTVLGLLGIGLPDIVAFIGFILRGIYEDATEYGVDYNVPAERIKILLMIEGSLSRGEKWDELSRKIDAMSDNTHNISENDLKKQIEITSDLMAVELLVLKFIQGIPVIGAIGGVVNPIYYKKIMKYVKIKYHKHYVKEKIKILKSR